MDYITSIKEQIKNKYPEQKEFIQATSEILDSLSSVINEDSRFEQHKILEKLIEPDRVLSFDVEWVDDNGNVQTNKTKL